jgi:hypothetical protein
MHHDHASSTRHADQLVALSIQNFPLTHWGDHYIRQAFQGFGTVIEVDWRCLSGFDYSSVRVVIRVDEVTSVPEDLWVKDVSTGAFDVCAVQLICAWPKLESFDDYGNYTHFFGAPLSPLPPCAALPPPLHCAFHLPYLLPPSANMPPGPSHLHKPTHHQMHTTYALSCLLLSYSLKPLSSYPYRHYPSSSSCRLRWPLLSIWSNHAHRSSLSTL